MVLIAGKFIINSGSGSWRYLLSVWSWYGCCSGGAAIKGWVCTSTLENYKMINNMRMDLVLKYKYVVIYLFDIKCIILYTCHY